MKEKTRPKGEAERFCLFENKSNCPSTEVKSHAQNLTYGISELLACTRCLV